MIPPPALLWSYRKCNCTRFFLPTSKEKKFPELSTKVELVRSTQLQQVLIKITPWLIYKKSAQPQTTIVWVVFGYIPNKDPPQRLSGDFWISGMEQPKRPQSIGATIYMVALCSLVTKEKIQISKEYTLSMN